MPVPSFTAAVGVIDGDLHVVNGHPSTGSAHQVYDPATNAWTVLAAPPFSIVAMAAGVLDDKLYAAGGFRNSDSNLPTNVLHVYDPLANTWTTKAPMPTVRGDTAAAVIDGRLYVAGGAIHHSFDIPSFTALEVYDPSADSWTTMAAMPTGREGAAGVALDGKFYVMGGFIRPSHVSTGTLEIYDPVTDAWTTGASMPTPRSRLAAGAIDGKIYAVGGHDGATTGVSVVEVYDPTSNTWSTDAPMPTGRHALESAVMDGKLFAVGGQGNTGSLLNVLEAFTPAPAVTQVTIDVKPGSDPNSINLASNGVIAVALYTTADFDASQVDVSTVNFAGAWAVHSALEDVDGDGDLDMILHFRTQDTVLDDIYAQLVADDINADGVLDSNKQEVEVSLTGETLDDQLFAGTDELDLFLAGKSLRSLLDELAAAGLI